MDQAVADGATIDEITARIRAEGEDCSRSAVGRYTKDMRDLIRQQQETDRTVKAWADALGERPEGGTGRILIETLQTMVLATMAALSKREEPASLEELTRLSHILKRIESTDKLRKDGERAAEKAEKAEKAAQANRPKGQGGLSPEARRHHPAQRWRAGRPRPPGAYGELTTVPADPRDPSRIPPVPANPSQSRIIPANPA